MARPRQQRLGLLLLGLAILFRWKLTAADSRQLSPLLCLLLVCWDHLVYTFLGKPGSPDVAAFTQLHDLPVAVSAAAVIAACIVSRRRIAGKRPDADIDA